MYKNVEIPELTWPVVYRITPKNVWIFKWFLTGLCMQNWNKGIQLFYLRNCKSHSTSRKLGCSVELNYRTYYMRHAYLGIFPVTYCFRYWSSILAISAAASKPSNIIYKCTEWIFHVGYCSIHCLFSFHLRMNFSPSYQNLIFY